MVNAVHTSYIPWGHGGCAQFPRPFLVGAKGAGHETNWRYEVVGSIPTQCCFLFVCLFFSLEKDLGTCIQVL